MTARVEVWRPDDAGVEMLAEVLHATVHAGAGISFIVPFSMDDARSYWREKIVPMAQDGARRVLVARLGDRIAGTVQVELDTPPNQRHRAGVAKMMVHPDARRCGIGRMLMIAVEEIARSENRTLLTLDTVTGSNAESLYRSLGYVVSGIIPRYARGSVNPELEGTTIMYKELTTA